MGIKSFLRAFFQKSAILLLFLAAANLALWLVAILTFHHYPVLLGTCFLATSFGLRHAVDADHIAAIDNVTRKLMQQGQRPFGVGFFFSLGHSTIVFALSAAVALTAITIKSRFATLETFGNIAGTIISAAFLFAIAAMNAVILAQIWRAFRHAAAGAPPLDLTHLLARGGLFARLFSSLFRLINHSWQMYPIGLLFGLGFDTATEIGLLGISAAEASKGLPLWSIMLFPALFTAAMALIDTADSALMVNAYAWAFAKPMRKLFYNLTITAVSVVVALIVGAIEVLGLAQDRFNLTGAFWTPIAALNNNFGLLGYLIIAIFMASWIVSMTIYKLKRYDEVV